MKKSLFLILPLLLSFLASAQHSHYYYQRASLFEKLPVTPEDIVFLGNSITDGGEWCELFDSKHIKNRGINGDNTQGVYDRLGSIVKGKPAKIFLLIGINDVARGLPVDTIVGNIEKITQKIKKESPTTRLYIQSVLPVNDYVNAFTGHTLRWSLVPEINKGLQALAQREQVTYIDLFSHFTEEGTDKLSPLYTNEGLHLMGEGYIKWAEIVRPYVEE